MESTDIFKNAGTIDDLIALVQKAYVARTPVAFGVTKQDGVSLQKTRRTANDAAVQLLSELAAGPQDVKLTDDQRATLAKYTGEGGLNGEGGSQYEYYTPQFMAEGIWDLMGQYSAGAGHILEPSAGTGIFQETKPTSAVMTSAELSGISGQINKLLHPEDDVNIGAFEGLASKTPDGTYDHAVGNVPFGDGRSGVAQLDPAYAKEKNVGNYFVLRTIDKVKPGGMVVLVVPNGMTDSSKSKKLRDQVSRKAEFLGAHRMPSGTFAESGTSTVVDVWVLRKHPEALKNIIDDSSDSVLTAANVLWPEYLTGKWFLQDGKPFIHGTMKRTDYQNMLVVEKDGQVTNASMKQALSHRFESRIDYDALKAPQPTYQGAEEGDRRVVGGIWHVFDGNRWVQDSQADTSEVDPAKYGAASYAELAGRTSSPEGMLSFSAEQAANIASSYPQLVSEDHRAVIEFAAMQSPALRERVYRGGVIGLRIIAGMDAQAKDMSSAEAFADASRLCGEEFKKYGRSDTLKVKGISNNQSRAFFAFQGNMTADGEVSAMLSGTLDNTGGNGVNMADPEQVVSHIFSQINLTPVTLDDFRSLFEGTLPDDDSAALDYLAGFSEIALDGNGNILPMSRATSGDVKGLAKSLIGMASELPEGPQQDNFLRQAEAIAAKRNHTPLNKIKVSLNSRWTDRRLVKEFLADQGYDQFKYTAPELDIQNGELLSEDDYPGRDGVFTGYQMRTVVSPKTGEKEFKKASNSDGFLNQLENYLNGIKPRGVNAGRYLSQIADLEASFNEWIAAHASAEQVEDDYNDAFNGYIPFTHSDASLNLSGISGSRVPMSHQNEEVRRLSEDGRGIMGFGTGLGKTTTALALEAYNFENGRTKRTATVVPKAVYQNWYHEAKGFYSAEAFSAMLFVGLEPVLGQDGQVLQAQVKNEKNEPVFDDNGAPVMRDVVKESSAADILLRLNQIPTSQWRNVIMTKEQFAMIPLRQETIEDNQQQAVFDAIESGRLNIGKSSHREATKLNRLKDKAADTGTAKKQNIPYFEDMNFDSVIADEGHNYRNSFSAGREAGQLAYLPNPSVSQVSRDMSVKSSYLMNKNNGRGVVLLTATPLVNSPIDAFNMLSHVIPPSEWQAMGIYTPDDFVRVFGDTETVDVQTISGAIEQKQGLVGFKNLDGLRGIFHRWSSIKTADDVKASVKIPDLVEKSVDVPMTEGQQSAYETLRERAAQLSKGNPSNPDEGTGQPPEDAIFSIIRDMDKVSLDPDLYANKMRWQFPADQADKVKAIFDALPTSAGGDPDSDANVNPLKQPTIVNTSLTTKGDILELTVSDTLEKQVLKAIADAGIDLSTVSHPVPPKYSALIENLRAGLENGKQIIFIDEKTQHGKLQRIISQALGMPTAQIGIINATTVAAAGGSKIKPVKQPVEPKEGKDGYKDGAWEKYYADKARYEDYIAAQNDMSLSGMEGIAADYNEGRTPIVICNRKAEVGINLHKGTTDIHHLTFPWTPASINQRNGRGARVGSSNDKVHVHYYCGKGTFDDFRLETLQRKKDWLTTIMTSDASEMANGDASSADERAIMLAANPEERRAMMAQQKAEREAEKHRVAVKNATNALNNYLKASNAAARPIDDLQKEYDLANDRATQANDDLEKARSAKTKAESEYNNANANKSPILKMYADDRRNARRTFNEASETALDAQADMKKAANGLKRAQTAGATIKRAYGDVDRAIKSGLLDVDPDVLQNPAEYLQLADGRLVRKGNYFETTGSTVALVKLVDIYPDKGQCDVKVITPRKNNDYFSRWNPGQVRTIALTDLGAQQTVADSDEDLLITAAKGVTLSSLPMTFTRVQFDKLAAGDGVKVEKSRSSYSSSDVNFWLYTDGDSFTAGNPKASTLQGTNVVYPDPTDEQLKKRVAEWVQANSSEKFYQSDFLRVLYGSNYDQVLETYGEQGTLADATTATDDYIRELEATSQYAPFYKTTLAQGIDSFINPAEQVSYWKTAISTRSITPRIPQVYTNRRELGQMVMTVIDARFAAKTDALTQARNAYAKAIKQAIDAVSTDDIKANLSQMIQLDGTGMIYEACKAKDLVNSQLPLYIATGEYLKAFDSTGELITQVSGYKTLAGSIHRAAFQLKQGGYKTSGLVEGEADMTYEQWLSALDGKLSDDDRKAIADAAAQKAAEIAQAATQAQTTEDTDGYTITVNQTALEASVKSKFRGRFYTRTLDIPANGGLVLVDTGAEPVLKQKSVREFLKREYAATFWDFSQNPVAGAPFDSPAWIIAKNLDPAEVREKISQFAAE